ncbi:MAG: M48 family metalloprotease [Thermoleophilia bacterium]
MGFYATIAGHRRLAILLFGLLLGHLLLITVLIYVLVRYQQFWLVPVVFWLPLLLFALKFVTRELRAVFAARDDDIAAAAGLSLAPPAPGEPSGRVLANVVEEMAVATGGPQPEASLTDSPALNAFVSFVAGSRQREMKIVFTSAMAAALRRQELQGVAASLYSHRRHFERMFAAMAGAMFLAAYAAADVFLLLNLLNWHYGGSGDFNTGPLVVVLALGILAAPMAAARLAQLAVMRRFRLLDDLGAIEITNDPESLITALEKLANSSDRLRARYGPASAHFFFAAVTDPEKRFPWQKLATHPAPEARVRALRQATGSQGGQAVR